MKTYKQTTKQQLSDLIIRNIFNGEISNAYSFVADNLSEAILNSGIVVPREDVDKLLKSTLEFANSCDEMNPEKAIKLKTTLAPYMKGQTGAQR